MNIKNESLLKELSLFVRYCIIEEPYWYSFITYHYSLGVRYINVLIQTKIDLISLESFDYPKDLNLTINEVNSNIDVDKTWLTLNFKAKVKPTRYALLIDADEFLYFLNPLLTLNEFMDSRVKRIPWVMNPIIDNKSENKGFFGNMFKEIAFYEDIKKIKNCHRFTLKRKFNSIHLKIGSKSIIGEDLNKLYSYKSGVILIHNWARSLNDVIIRGIYSRIEKNTQKEYDLIQNIKNGKLSVRSKYLAFLDIQNKYISGLDTSYKMFFDQDKELELILKHLNFKELEVFYKNFYLFRNKLKVNIKKLPIFPPQNKNIHKQILDLDKLICYSDNNL